MNDEKKQHIGDGVYAHYDGYHIVLETADVGYPEIPDNTIYLDWSTSLALVNYMRNIGILGPLTEDSDG